MESIRQLCTDCRAFFKASAVAGGNDLAAAAEGANVSVASAVAHISGRAHDIENQQHNLDCLANCDTAAGTAGG
jgi:hypothetical protein